MMSGIQLNTLVDFHVLTEEQLNGILSQINQAQGRDCTIK